LTSPDLAPGAPAQPLPNAVEQLEGFNEGRRLWRAAIRAIAPLVGFGTSRRSSAPAAPPAGGGAHAWLSSPHQSGAPTAEARAELQAAFAAFDRDGNGSIDVAELRCVLTALGAREAEAEATAARVLAVMDADGDASISLEEFVEQATISPLLAAGASLRRVFAVFDADGSDGIDQQEFATILGKLNMTPPGGAAAAAQMFASADADGNGQISFDEFCVLVKGSLS
jgi:Ca2+-binding EF-hand superfamily protein